MNYQYYPGCSVKGTAKPYEESLLAVFDALGVDVTELQDWNCCGATAYMSVDGPQSLALASRNLAMADSDGGGDLITPCNACYLVLNKAQKQLADNPDRRARVCNAMKNVGLDYKGTTKVRHIIEVLAHDIGPEGIKEKVTAPLEGLNVAPYYGCQIVRPYALFDDQHNPTTMDHLIAASGAKVVDYAFKTRCCGGSQTGTIPDVGLDLVHQLLREAKDSGADVIATVCPLCQFNMEAYQDRIQDRYGLGPIPVVYITQIIGAALGIPANELGLDKCIVPAADLLTRRTADVA